MIKGNIRENFFDVAVVGGGPAGMMAAVIAAEEGARVVLLEKNKTLGKKLLLTGNGKCNITNNESDIKKLISFYGKGGGFLYHALNTFGPGDVVNFFHLKGVKTKTERGKRVFPKNEKAKSVLQALEKAMTEKGVTVVCLAEVSRPSFRKKRIEKLVLKNKKTIRAKSYIFSTGGMSYPFTGSTGDGFRWAKNFSHTVKELTPSLVPLKIKEDWVKELQGLSLKNIEITFIGKKKKIKEFGECLFTHYGMSGPAVLKASKEVGKLQKGKEVKINLDLKPALNYEKLDKRVKRDFEKYANKEFKNSLYDLLPKKMIPVVVSLSSVSPEKKVNEVTKKERQMLLRVLKKMEFTVEGVMGFNSAIVTSGGISLSEIDEKTMQSKKIENLFFAGEIIDVDGPTGGFNLQVSWSTGYLAGKSSSKIWKD